MATDGEITPETAARRRANELKATLEAAMARDTRVIRTVAGAGCLAYFAVPAMAVFGWPRWGGNILWPLVGASAMMLFCNRAMGGLRRRRGRKVAAWLAEGETRADVPMVAELARMFMDGTQGWAPGMALADLLPRCRADEPLTLEDGRAILRLLESEDREVVMAALQAIGELAPEGAEAAVEAFRLRPVPVVKETVVDSAGTNARPGSLLHQVRQAAGECLHTLRRRGVAAPSPAATDAIADAEVRRQCARLLIRLELDRRQSWGGMVMQGVLCLLLGLAGYHWMGENAVVLLGALVPLMLPRKRGFSSKETRARVEKLIATDDGRAAGPLAAAYDQGDWRTRRLLQAGLQRLLPRMGPGDLDGVDPACGRALVRLLRAPGLTLPVLHALAVTAPPGARIEVEALRADPSTVTDRDALRYWHRTGRAEPGSSLAELFAAIDACLEALAVHEQRGALRDTLVRPAAEGLGALVRPAAEGALPEEALVRPMEDAAQVVRPEGR